MTSSQCFYQSSGSWGCSCFSLFIHVLTWLLSIVQAVGDGTEVKSSAERCCQPRYQTAQKRQRNQLPGTPRPPPRSADEMGVRGAGQPSAAHWVDLDPRRHWSERERERASQSESEPGCFGRLQKGKGRERSRT